MSNISIQQTILNVPEGKHLVLQNDQRIVQPNYYRIGNGTMNKHGIQSTDLIDEVMNMSKAEQFLIKQIKAGSYYDTEIGAYTFVTTLDQSAMTSTEKQYILKGYKLLLAKNLVKRVRRGAYMINPTALVPNRYEDAQKLWSTL